MKFTDTKSIMLHLKQVQVGKEIQNKDLALQLGISESAVSSLYKQKNISLNKLAKLCSLMNCDLDITFVDKET